MFRSFAFLVTLAALQACTYKTDEPEHHWYTEETELEIDGEVVTVGGMIECAQRRSWRPNASYDPSTRIFAKRLKDGSAILIKPKVACSHSYPLSKVYPEGYRPLVAWLDDVKKPTRMEIYFANASRLQPDARVRFRNFSASRVGPPKEWRPNNWQNSARRDDPRLFPKENFAFDNYWPPGTVYWKRTAIREVPSLGFPPLKQNNDFEFFGYIVTVAEESAWRRISGLDAFLDSIKEVSVLEKEHQAFAGNEERLARVRELVGWNRSMRGDRADACRGEDGPRHPECEGLARSYGMVPIRDRRGARYSSAERTVGSVVLLPRTAAQRKSRIEEFTFDGAVIQHEPVFRTLFYNPKTRRLYGVRSIRSDASGRFAVF